MVDGVRHVVEQVDENGLDGLVQIGPRRELFDMPNVMTTPRRYMILVSLSRRRLWGRLCRGGLAAVRAKAMGIALSMS